MSTLDSETVIDYDPRIDIVTSLLHNSESVLDIGCVQHEADRQKKDHWLHEELDKVVDDLVGLDYLEEEVEMLRSQGYEIVCADAENFDLRREFDAIVAGELIEHLANPGEFLTCIRDHLSPSGRLILTTPNPWYGRRFLEAVQGHVRSNPEHTCWFDEQTLSQLLARYKFEIDDITYTPAPEFRPFFSSMNIESTITKSIYNLGFNVLAGYTLIITASVISS